MENLPYIGEGDLDLQFGGAVQNFAQEGHAGKQFSFSVSNAALVNRTVQLFAGYLTGSPLRPGQLTDGAFNDIQGNPGLEAVSGDDQIKIAELHEFLKHNPTRLVMMRIQSTDERQMNEKIRISQHNVFARQGTETIDPAIYKTAGDFNSKIVTFPVDVQLDDKSDVKYTFVNGSTTTITLYFGATLDKALSLRRKAAIARANVNRVGAAAIVHNSVSTAKQIG
jgi:hypothetical protein